MAAKDKLTTKKKFRDCLLPLTESERSLLEEQIVLAGQVINPILTWNGIIIDGHHRYEIAERLGLPYETKEMEFESEEHALIWIMEQQVGQRNLEEEQKENISLALKESYSSTGYGTKWLDRIAEVFGVGRTTVFRWISNSEVRRSLETSVAKKLKAGEIKMSAATMKQMSSLPPQQQKDIAKEAKEKDCPVKDVMPDPPPKPFKKKKEQAGATSKSPGPEEPVELDPRGKPFDKKFAEDFAETAYDEILHGLAEFKQIAKSRISNGARGKLFMLSSFLEAIEAAEHEVRRATPFSTCPECGGKKCQLCNHAGIVAQHIIVDFESKK